MALTSPPLLLPGENLEHYQLMRQAILADVAPRSAIEWLLAFDVVELSWAIQRYRMRRYKTPETFRQQAIERALSRIDLVGIPLSLQSEVADHYTRLNALSWRSGPAAATEIELRLAAYGFNQDTISVEICAQARELFLMFESLLSTQNRRTILLREIANQRRAKQGVGSHQQRMNVLP